MPGRLFSARSTSPVGHVLRCSAYLVQQDLCETGPFMSTCGYAEYEGPRTCSTSACSIRACSKGGLAAFARAAPLQQLLQQDALQLMACSSSNQTQTPAARNAMPKMPRGCKGGQGTLTPFGCLAVQGSPRVRSRPVVTVGKKCVVSVCNCEKRTFHHSRVASPIAVIISEDA